MPPKAAARATTALRAGTREALCEQLAAQAEMRAGFRDAREVMLEADGDGRPASRSAIAR